MKILVTGAGGFIGAGLLPRLQAEPGATVRAATRREGGLHAPDIEQVIVGDGFALNLRAAMNGVNVVIHLAARVHIMRETAGDPLSEFRRANVDGTVTLAQAAVAAGVRRFVFVSSAKVNGENGRFVETDAPAPRDAYGTSKYEAEIALRAIAASSGMEVAIIRPPLVYGPGVGANFLAAIRAIKRGWPLPLGAVNNRRSFVARDNLVDFLVHCVMHPAAANETFLVSDGEDLSTAELVRRLGRAMGRSVWLLPVPPALLCVGAAILGRRDMAQRLLGSFQLDISKARRQLGWKPPITVDEGLQQAVAQFV